MLDSAGGKAQSRARHLAQHRKKSVSALTRSLYRNVRGIAISSLVRKGGDDPGADDKHLTYGEIRVESFDLALSHASKYCRVKRGVFYDLGSGTGKALFAAAFNLHLHFDRCVGLEIMSELSDVANTTLGLFQSSMASAHEKISAAGNAGHVFQESVAKSSTLKAGKTYSEMELRELVAEIAMNREEDFLLAPENEPELANALVKKIGHKSFKASLKPFKSFHKFMSVVAEQDASDEKNGNGKAETEEGDPLPSSPRPPTEDGDELVSEGEGLVRELLQKDVLASLTSPSPADMQALCQDIFTYPWHKDASVVYCSSLLFSPEMMSRLVVQVAQMQPGSVFMSLKKLPLEELGEETQSSAHLVFESFYEMSWHRCRVYFYKLESM